MKNVYVARDPHEKAMQRALLQYMNPKNADLVRAALRKAGRQDLIGYQRGALIRPEGPPPMDKTKPTKGSRPEKKDNKKRAR